MTSHPISVPGKKATNLSISEAVLREAKELQIDVSRAAEAGLGRAITKERAQLWLQENVEALQSSNDYVERNGLPLAKYRQF